MSNISWTGMTRNSYTPGRTVPVRVLVIHATAGTFPGDRDWLQRGGSLLNPVSCHYLIDKTGAGYQFVRERDTAWHAGKSAWTIDGVRRENLNPWSIGIELSNRNNGVDPYPQAQFDAAVALSREIVTRYAIPRSQLVRHLDISPGRKTDPVGFRWSDFVHAVYQTNEPRYTADAPLLGQPLGTYEQAVSWFAARSTLYSRVAIGEIVTAYQRVGDETGLDWFLALAQCAHETGSLTSWWCDRPRRNPAGIGVTGHSIPGTPTLSPGRNWAYRDGRWYEGASFAQWDDLSVAAHLGRLLAYALTDEQANDVQRRRISYALSVRPLPSNLRGVAPTLGALNGRWAVPGTSYGQSIAGLANRMRAL